MGNLSAKRDWGHAKDYVEGMWLMLQQKKADDYVLSTGKSYSVRDFVTKCFNHIGINIKWSGKGLKEIGINKSNKKILVKIDKRYLRPNELHHLLGDSSKAYKTLKWKHNYNLKSLIKEMIDEEEKKQIINEKI